MTNNSKFKLLRNLKPEHIAGLLFVLALHGGVLYELWSYRVISTPDEAITLMVNLINPPAPEQPVPRRPVPPKTVKSPPHPAPPHLAAAPVVLPNEPVAYVPPPPPPVVVAPQMPAQPLILSGELSVVCPDRSAPDYPKISMRMNEQGKVVLRVELGEDGRIAHAEVKTSSGFSRLDAAALNAVKTWHCKPSVRNGVATRAVALQPLNFILGER